MVVILTGCDCTGKSTCFEKLKKEFDAFFNKGDYTDNAVEKISRVIEISRQADSESLFIYDRATVIDDVVYEPVFSNNASDLFAAFSMQELSDIISKCIVIYFDCDNYVLTQRLIDRKDDYVQVNQLNKIKRSYDNAFKILSVEHDTVDTTDKSEDEVYQEVRKIINEKLKNS